MAPLCASHLVDSTPLFEALTELHRAHADVDFRATEDFVAPLQSAAFVAASRAASVYNRLFVSDGPLAIPMFTRFYGEATGHAVLQMTVRPTFEELTAPREWEWMHYLTPQELLEHRLIVAEGKFHWALSGRPARIDNGIYVMGLDREIYAQRNDEHDDSFHHSSFFNGDPVLGAGRITTLKDGTVKAIDRHSGHYEPTISNFSRMLRVLERRGLAVPLNQTGWGARE